MSTITITDQITVVDDSIAFEDREGYGNDDTQAITIVVETSGSNSIDPIDGSEEGLNNAQQVSDGESFNPFVETLLYKRIYSIIEDEKALAKSSVSPIILSIVNISVIILCYVAIYPYLPKAIEAGGNSLFWQTAFILGEFLCWGTLNAWALSRVIESNVLTSRTVQLPAQGTVSFVKKKCLQATYIVALMVLGFTAILPATYVAYHSTNGSLFWSGLVTCTYIGFPMHSLDLMFRKIAALFCYRRALSPEACLIKGKLLSALRALKYNVITNRQVQGFDSYRDFSVAQDSGFIDVSALFRRVLTSYLTSEFRRIENIYNRPIAWLTRESISIVAMSMPIIKIIQDVVLVYLASGDITSIFALRLPMVALGVFAISYLTIDVVRYDVKGLFNLFFRCIIGDSHPRLSRYSYPKLTLVLNLFSAALALAGLGSTIGIARSVFGFQFFYQKLLVGSVTVSVYVLLVHALNDLFNDLTEAFMGKFSNSDIKLSNRIIHRLDKVIHILEGADSEEIRQIANEEGISEILEDLQKNEGSLQEDVLQKSEEEIC